jgi:hypothetical protein
MMLSGGGKGRAKRPELVVLVSYELAKRGWTDVREGELCKIPGVGPVSPQVAREIAKDAFLNGVFFDGVDLRNSKRWSRNIPVELAIAPSRWPSPWNLANPQNSTASSASTAAIVFAPSSTMSSRASL